jgi:hypothetical protein
MKNKNLLSLRIFLFISIISLFFNSINNRQFLVEKGTVKWVADIPGSSGKYIAFFNPTDSPVPIEIIINFENIDLNDREYQVRDLWAKKDLGIYKDRFSAAIPSHGAGLYKISK